MVAAQSGLLTAISDPRAATSHLPCSRYDTDMRDTESHSETLSLEFDAARAGAALVCAYSNSAEFDAALIAARRAAGVYGTDAK
jgi:hypothetical protein